MSMAKMPSIPGFECVRLLGINLGTVFLARESSTGTLVALKVYRPELAQHFQEAHGALARLDHPNIARILASGDAEGCSFHALEYSEETLADRLQHGPLAHAEVVRISLAIASALEHARRRGMTSALTPGTILLGKTDVPKLTDFHLAAERVDTDIHFVSPFSPFMAKEELEGKVTPA